MLNDILAVLRRGMKKYGEEITLLFNDRGVVYTTRGILQDYRKDFRRKYDSNLHMLPLGSVEDSDKVLFVAAESGGLWMTWMEDVSTIYVKCRGKMYEVVADSPMYLGEQPLYFWALIRPLIKDDSDYYGDLDGEQSEAA